MRWLVRVPVWLGRQVGTQGGRLWSRTCEHRGWAEGSLGSKRHFRVRSTSGVSPSRSGGGKVRHW